MIFIGRVGLAGRTSANVVPASGGWRRFLQTLRDVLQATRLRTDPRLAQVQVPGQPSEFFSDSKHGGAVGAFRKARQRAQEMADPARVNLKTRRYLANGGAQAGAMIRLA